MANPVATYTFLPWLRQGIAAQIAQTDTLGSGGPSERASVHMALTVNGQQNFAAADVHLQGPGDVIGIHPQAIVRTEPRSWATDFEANYLTAIDFYDEDFPWRYTPVAAAQLNDQGATVNDRGQTKLRPWIVLVALDESEFTDNPAAAGRLSTITLTVPADAVLPPPAQAWAWAHVHVSSDVTNAGSNDLGQSIAVLTAQLQANPDVGLSRLICPRKLKEETAYHAFLLPAFEIGRRAGLGLPTVGQDALAPSWGTGQTEYPVYYRWFFRTAKRGDFEYLVNLLQPRAVDPRVGIRDMDMQVPGFDVPGMSNHAGESAVMGLEGALKSPQAAARPAVWPPAAEPAFLKRLEEVVNLQDDLLRPPPGGQAHPDPVISPPLYGRWHALQDRLKVASPGWVNELNRDPRLRVPANFGTEVIQANQETYMEKAWRQVGDVLAANQIIRQFQLSIAASAQVYTRSYKTLDASQKLALSSQVLPRVLGSPTTLAFQIKQSRLPGAALQPAFRRMTRPRGALMRRVLPAGSTAPAPMLARFNAVDGVTAAPPKQASDRMITLEKLTHGIVTPATPVAPATPTHVGIGPVLGPHRTAKGLDVKTIPPRPGFSLTDLGGHLPVDIGKNGPADSAQGTRFRLAFVELNTRLEFAVPDNPLGPSLDFDQAVASLDQTLNPVRVLPQRARQVLQIPDGYQPVKPVETIAPVMAHPVIDDAMYKPLADLSSELLIPNLSLIPNNTLTLLETNPRFIEAYVVGLNQEFARELLWREYPTDMRPSTFLLFWEPAEKASRDIRIEAGLRARQLRDFKPLHEWNPATPLGTHENKPLPSGSESGAARLVLAVRGDLLKRYPTAMIYAQKAVWTTDPNGPPGTRIRVLDESNPDQNILEPAFKAEVLPDLRFIGFNLTVKDAKGSPKPADNAPGWFFVIQERPGEPRFGLEITDAATAPPPIRWEDLTWNHLGDPATVDGIRLSPAPVTTITSLPDSAVRWGSNAADMAYILFRAPVMVAVHAESMLA